MFGLVKIQEMIPGNKHIVLKTSFSCEIQQVIWVICLKTEKMELVDGGHLEFWYLDSSKYKNDARNGLSIPHLVGKVILHGFQWPFTFKLHFQCGRRRPSWILMVVLVKIQKRCQKWILHAKIKEKWYYTAFEVNLFSSCISNMAAGGHFGFWLLTNSAAIFARVMGANCFLNTSKSSNQESNLTMLSVVTGPPDCTQLYRKT